MAGCILLVKKTLHHKRRTSWHRFWVAAFRSGYFWSRDLLLVKLLLISSSVVECEELVPAMLRLMETRNEDARFQGCAECLVWLPCFVVVQALLPCLAAFSRCRVKTSFSWYLFWLQRLVVSCSVCLSLCCLLPFLSLLSPGCCCFAGPFSLLCCLTVSPSLLLACLLDLYDVSLSTASYSCTYVVAVLGSLSSVST